MFGSVSFNEILLILVIALVIFGPKRLPQIGRTVGKALGEFRRASNDLKRTMETEMSSIDREVAAQPSAAEQITPAVGTVERIEPSLAAPPESDPASSESADTEPAVPESTETP
jgi:TatA/E family protein of Tat protein translocase